MSYNGSPPPYWGEGQPPDSYTGRADEALRAYSQGVGRERAWQELEEQRRRHGEQAAEEWARRRAAEYDSWQRQQAAAVQRAAAADHGVDSHQAVPATDDTPPRLILPEGFEEQTTRSSGSTPSSLAAANLPAPPLAGPSHSSGRGRGALAFFLVLALLVAGAIGWHYLDVKRQKDDLIQRLANVSCAYAYNQMKDNWNQMRGADQKGPGYHCVCRGGSAGVVLGEP
ncbi:hypothetical protein [Micromonospora sp. SL4-19]|uniref:hypothetical protein n=1 Tax=Micromonospora sp. SL4-19 TaxID=3399129 RepID=UPI003A4D4BCE